MTQQSKYNYYADAEHAWLEVPRSEVEASGISVTPYSYYDPETDMVYLEEDVDMMNFMKATGITLASIRMLNDFSPRKLPLYEKAK